MHAVTRGRTDPGDLWALPGLFDPVTLSMHCVGCAVIVSAAHASVPEPGGKALQKGFLCPKSGGVVSNLVPTCCSC